ncbi:ABC transporter G family member 24 [Porphyridium purpureum]|uniref:ABC transporter G family member 24 n=1 Tax=Porphyridium purpureum TaxID=35688 RepID=A0A5J4Z7H4_PORPP|nr:ABC transporter G family member 24 [Porphyridium purpureum]|eukprot:POR6832..scf295_1
MNLITKLVAEPSALFLEEWTSGLDSSLARVVHPALHYKDMRCARVVAVLHSPKHDIHRSFNQLFLFIPGIRVSNVSLCDKVGVSLESLVFGGSARGNLAKYLMDVFSGSRVHDIYVEGVDIPAAGEVAAAEHLQKCGETNRPVVCRGRCLVLGVATSHDVWHQSKPSVSTTVSKSSQDQAMPDQIALNHDKMVSNRIGYAYSSEAMVEALPSRTLHALCYAGGVVWFQLEALIIPALLCRHTRDRQWHCRDLCGYDEPAA